MRIENDPSDIRTAIVRLGGIRRIQALLGDVRTNVQAFVLGECIEDVYRYVRPEGLSSKSPTLSCRWVREETSRGGAWAIANHLHEFCPTSQGMSGVVHRKIRYISETTNQRLFEVCDIRPERQASLDITWPNLQVIADFGHGLFEQTGIPNPMCLGGTVFQAMNVQTNSSNFGFNPFHKRRSDYLVIDKRELQLGFNDRSTNVLTLGARLHESWAAPIAITLGPAGAVLFDQGIVHESPAFTPGGIVDATGAGDAFFALTSALVAIGAPPELTVFLGTVFAGLKTQIIGNSRSVTKAELLGACATILGEVLEEPEPARARKRKASQWAKSI